MRGGFVFYGGLLGGLFGIYLGGKILKIPVWEYAQNTIPVIPLAHGFGRLGCLMAGCCYGVPYDGVLDGELRETQTTDYFSKHRRSDCAVRELTAR